MQDKFADVWTEAIEAAAEAREHRRLERRYIHMLRLTDGLLERLERMNLAERPELDQATQHHIAKTLLEVTPTARERFRPAGTVQQALDGVFEVQGPILLELRRARQREAVVTEPWAAASDGEHRPMRWTA